MNRFVAVLGSTFGVWAGLVGCAPALTVPQTQIDSRVQVEGHLLLVTLTNAGPLDLLLKNDCPRPFGLTVLDGAGAGQPVKFTPLEVCSLPQLPPVLWRVGQSVTAGVEFPLVAGSRTLSAQATVRARLASDTRADFKTLRVNVAPFQVTIR